MTTQEQAKELSLKITAFQQKLSGVLQIFGEQGKPGQPAAFKKKIPNTLDFRAWKPGCDKCTTITKFEVDGDFILIEGITNIPPIEELNVQKDSIATRVKKEFELYVGEHYNNPFIKTPEEGFGKLEMNPLYRYVTFDVVHDVDLT